MLMMLHNLTISIIINNIHAFGHMYGLTVQGVSFWYIYLLCQQEKQNWHHSLFGLAIMLSKIVYLSRYEKIGHHQTTTTDTDVSFWRKNSVNSKSADTNHDWLSIQCKSNLAFAIELVTK